MLQDEEHEIQLQFLEEATEHLKTITEAIFILAVPCASLDNQRIDAALRAAHSIKGGAAMMEFHTLSELARRIEVFFKVLKTQHLPIETHLNQLLITATDHLSRLINCHRQGEDIDEQWVEKYVYPIFERIDLTLESNPTFEDTATLPEEEQNMAAMIFETEVEGYLAKLELVLASGVLPGLFAQTSVMAQELGGLGEMLQLTAFTSLCESITQHLEANPERVEEIARMALQEWRRSQAAVLLGQVDTIPTSIDFGDCESRDGDNRRSTAGSVPAPTNIQALDFNTNHLINFKENQPVRLTIKQLQQLKDYFAELSKLHERTTFCLAQVSNLFEQVASTELLASPLDKNNSEFAIPNFLGNGVRATSAPSGNLSKVSYPSSRHSDVSTPKPNSQGITPLEPNCQKKTILVVDDDKIIRSILSSLLESAGYQVELALDGLDALKKLDNGLQVQAVICDLDMPNLNGYGFLTSIKSDPKFKHLPVAMLTSHTESNYRERAMLLGAAAYFTKPCDRQELLNALGQLIATTSP